MSKWLFVGAFLCAVAACGGGGSGVSSGKTLVSLSDSEITDLCEYLVDVAGPARTVDCGGGDTVMIGGGSVSACTTGLKAARTEDPSCGATVNDAESCSEDLSDLSDAELCSDSTPFPSACLPLLQCDAEI